MNFFGRNLRYLREKYQLTQEEMAPRLGVTNTTWSNYENGVSQPPIESLIKISSYFGISLDELILGDVPALDGMQVKQRKHKPYIAMNHAPTMYEEEIIYLSKELKKLRKDVELIKKEIAE